MSEQGDAKGTLMIGHATRVFVSNALFVDFPLVSVLSLSCLSCHSLVCLLG